MSIRFHLTCVVQDPTTASRLEDMASFCLQPAQYLFGGRQVSRITPALLQSIPIYQSSDRSWLKMASMIVLLIPGLLIGGLCKAVAVYLYHIKEHDALAERCLNLATQSATQYVYNISGNSITPYKLDTYLFEGWESEGDIETAKQRIRECLTTQGISLNLSNLRLTSLPASINTLTQLQTIFCDQNRLTTLPDLSRLTQLQTLFCGQNFLTALPDLSRLTQLQRLNCSSNQLTTLPDLSTLTQLQRLNCSSNQLTALPDLSTLTQLQQLSCYNNRLTALPDLSTLTQLQYLSCSNNQLTALPEAILRLPASCFILATGNPFPPELIDRLQRATTAPNYLGPRTIQYSMGVVRGIAGRSIENILGGFFTMVLTTYALEALSPLWTDPAQQRTLKTWLNKLIQNAPEMRNEEAKAILARRVLEVFHFAAINETYRTETFFFLINEGLTDCIDRTAYYLNHLEASMRLHQVPLEQAASLFREAWAMHLLYDIAERKLRTLVLTDPIETHLAYHYRLRERWFPKLISPMEMRFMGCSGVREQDITAAGAELNTAIHNPNPRPFIDFLSTYHPWTTFLDRTYPGERLAALATYADQLEALSTDHDQTYRAASARIQSERTQAETAWISEKTRPLLGI
jgi:hypothetical protein